MKNNKAYFNYLRYTKNPGWSKYLLEKGVPISDFFYRREDNTVYIRSVDHSFSLTESRAFFDGYKKYCWKFLDNGFQFAFRNSDMYVNINDLTIKVETVEELFIINEVFLENMYKVESKSDYVVFDIGMNVGITSLYFSQFENIKDIYGFEPFTPTFNCACANVGLNIKNKSKLHLHNFGLSNADATINLPYDFKNRGNMGIKNSSGTKIGLDRVETIEFKKASDCLRNIIAIHPDVKFIAKIDCEGSEYDIMENLATAEMLQQFDIFLIEWHKLEGYLSKLNVLIATLKDNGFVVIPVGNFDSDIGMIYAVK